MPGITRDKGFVSLLILLTISALVWTGTQTFAKISSQERVIIYEGQKTRARYLADGGLEWAQDSLNADLSWRGGSQFLTTGEIRVEIKIISEGYHVTSRARSGKARHHVYCELIEDEDKLIMAKYGELFD